MDYDFDEIGALQSVTPEGGSAQPVEFDDGGHLTEFLESSMNYDPRGRLKSVTLSNGDEVEMVYDYRGARVVKRTIDADGPVEETHYIDEIYEERDGDDTAYVMVKGQFVGILTEDDERHLHPDYRGSIVLITGQDGAVDSDSWFSPYGADSETTGNLVSRRFTGAVYDDETGLVYLNQRCYSPVLGRFLTPDPMYLQQPDRSLKTPIEKNLYLYAASNPVEYVDPTGNFILTVSIAAAAGATIGGIFGSVAGARDDGFRGSLRGFGRGAIKGTFLGTAGTLAIGMIGKGTIIGAIAGGIYGAAKEQSFRGIATWGLAGAALGTNIQVAGSIDGVFGIGIGPCMGWALLDLYVVGRDTSPLRDGRVGLHLRVGQGTYSVWEYSQRADLHILRVVIPIKLMTWSSTGGMVKYRWRAEDMEGGFSLRSEQVELITLEGFHFLKTKIGLIPIEAFNMRLAIC